MRITSHGAAGDVTGSCHLVETNGQTILLDCGLYQGHRREAEEKNRNFPFDPTSLDAVILSHAHIDHSGRLPLLTKSGYKGPIYCTNATRDLCSVMLLDSASIQEADARYLAKHKKDPVEPLYTTGDVLAGMRQFVTCEYEMALPILDGAKLTFRDAGHVLGSANVTLDFRKNGKTGPSRRFIYSGDVGRNSAPLLRPRVPAENGNIVMVETTYGNRDHEPYEETGNRMAEVIRRTVDRGGKIIVPSFALERAQEVIYMLKLLLSKGRIPRIPVFVDSPLTSDITQIYRLHPECFDEEIHKLYIKQDSPFYFPNLTYIRDVEESKSLNGRSDSMLIISANGMCEAGRILHHLKNNISDDRNTVMIVGYQAEHTLGRRIVERQPVVNIFGQPHTLKAEVAVLNSLSAHADRNGLADWLEPSRETCEHLLLVHGEPDQSGPFAERMKENGFRNVHVQEPGVGVEA